VRVDEVRDLQGVVPAGLNAIFHIAVRERPFHNVLGAIGHLLVHIDVPRFGRRRISRDAHAQRQQE
jgi:hypothetical protein